MNKKKITCKEVMSHICENLTEDINSEKCKEIKRHLENCVDCKKYLESMELTIDCYRNYNIDLPQEAHQKLMLLLGLEEEK